MESGQAASGHFQPKVSVVVAGGDASALRESARSALAQDHPAIDILLAGSAAAEVARQPDFAADPRVRAPDGSGEAGPAGLNAAVAAATGDLVCVLPGAELLVPGRLSAQLAVLAGRSPEMRRRTVVTSDYGVAAAGRAGSLAVRCAEGFGPAPAAELVSRGVVHPATVLAPREMFETLGGLDPARPATGFHDLLGRARQAFDFVHVAEDLVRARSHALQAFVDAGPVEADRLWRDLRSLDDSRDPSAEDPNDYAFWMGAAERARSMGAADIATEAERQAAAALDRVRVSVVIPFGSGYVALGAAIRSALDQTHPNVEVVVVHDSPDPRAATVVPAEEAAGRVKTLCQHRRGVGEARNFGIENATGAYIAFLDSDDLFRPQKIRRQLAAMLLAGAPISHTSYHAACLDGTLPSQTHQSGRFSGQVFPRIICYCPIAMPTVMARTAFLRDGHMFPVRARGCEDFLLWIRIARDTEVLGINEPLSVVHVSARSVAYDPAQQKASLERVCEILEGDPAYAVHWSELHKLRGLIAGCRARLETRARAI